MSIRTLLLGVVFALLLVGVIVAGTAAIALGATPTAQQSSDDIAAWVSTTLKVPVAPRPVVIRALENYHDGEYDPATDIVSLTPESSEPTTLGLYVQLHELLHKPDTIDGCYREEEAVVDTLTRDLLPALTWRLLHRPLRGPISSVYDTRGPNGEPSVGDVLATSAVATGRPVGSREARLWRRALWTQGCAGRAAMLEEVADGR